MAEYTDDDLFDLDDDALEAAYKEAKAQEDNSELDAEPEVIDNSDEIIDNEEEIADELEQPDDQDSDDDASADDDTEESEEDESEIEEGEVDGQPTDVEEPTESEEEKVEEEVQPVQRQKFKANGLEYEFTPEEMMSQFPKVFGQAMDYTKKMQQIKPWRQTIDAIEQAQLSKDDVNLAIDVLKGDKDAIGALLKRTGVDALDLDVEESNYVPQDYGRDEATLALKDVVDEISVDPEYGRTQKVLANDWDESSWNEMTKDPNMIKALHVDVKSGTFDKVQPIAAKLKVYDGGRKTDLEYYKEAAGVYYNEETANAQAAQQEAERVAQDNAAKEAELARVKAEEAKRENVKQQADKRKRATPSKKGAGTKPAKANYLEDSDEDFEKWYAELQQKY